MTEATRTVLLVLLVIFISLAGARFLGRGKAGRRASPSLFRVTSLAYISLGVLLGRHGMGLLEGELLDNLEPVLELSLGWIGLMFGLQLDLRSLRKFPGHFFGLTMFQSVLSALVIGLAAWWLIGAAGVLDGFEAIRPVLLLAAAGAASSPTETALAASGGLRIKHVTARIAQYVTSVDPIIPVLLFSFLAGLFHVRSGGGMVPALEWTAASALIGLVLGLLFYSFARHRHSENELVMMIIAFTVFSGGIAAYLNLSSLFINLVAGVCLANLLPTSEKIFRALVSREKAVLIVLLVLVGASWEPFGLARLDFFALLLVVFALVRLLGKSLSLMIYRPLLRAEGRNLGWSTGLCLAGQGGMSVALVANYQLLFGGATDSPAVSVVLALVVLSEAFGAHAARYALRDNGEGGRG